MFHNCILGRPSLKSAAQALTSTSIPANFSLTTLSSKESENVSMFLTLIDWFVEEYTFTFEPQPRQISRWNYDRKNLFKNTEKIEELSETFCK